MAAVSRADNKFIILPHFFFFLTFILTKLL
jgi:hypothetical protein